MNPSVNLELRAAQPNDAAAIAVIWHVGWCDAHVGNVPDELLAARTKDSFSVRARQRLDDTTVAVIDGDIAGFFMVVDDDLEQLYVAAPHRGAGIADSLIEEAERQIAKAGHSSAWLAVVHGNERARRFYERRGWSDHGMFDHHAPGDHSPITVPAHRYVRELTATP
jgi:ribosomal protein S18 acetylase RimI-like enzyme